MSVRGIQEHKFQRKDEVMPTTPIPRRFWSSFAAVLALAFLLSLPALAQDPVVNSAEPSSAEQETTDLVVKVHGDNFGSDSEVDFFVTGTDEPGGIHVKKVKRQGPKTLKVTIDVAAGATVDDFDIQVRSRGRSGKGIELFRVLEKEHPSQDSIPPIPVIDLKLVDGTEQTPEGDYRAQLTWHAPADPPLMDAVFGYLIKARPGDSFTIENWEESMSSLYRAPGFPPLPGSPGTTDSAAPRFLAPETVYTVALRSVDASDNWSGLSNTVTFKTGPALPFPDWDAEKVDSCPPGSDHGAIGHVDLAYGSDGNPVVFYTKECDPSGPGAYVARWTESESESEWNWNRVAVDFPLGDGPPPFEVSPIADQPAILASPLAIQTEISLYRWTGTAWISEVIDSGKFPYGDRDLAAYSVGNTKLLAAAYRAAPKGRSSSIRLTVWDGEAWESHDISSSYNRGNAVAAFDDLGRPAVAYEDDTDRDGDTDTLQFALWNGASWESETIDDLQDPEHPICGWGASLEWNAARGEFWASHNCVRVRPDHSQRVRICGRTSPAGTWECSDVPEDFAHSSPALVFSPEGIAYVAVATQEHVTSGYGEMMLRLWNSDTMNPDLEWSSEIVDWTTTTNPPIGLSIDPLSNELGIFHYAPLRPVPTARLLRKSLP